MKCLIVAAGQGTRLRDKGRAKPLIPILGVPLIERVITRARSAGVDEFFVVSGYRGDDCGRSSMLFSAREGIPIAHIVNDRLGSRQRRLVSEARAAFSTQPFLLTMCDHLVDPEIFRGLMAAPFEPDTVTLAVDFNIADPLNDLDDSRASNAPMGGSSRSAR